MTEKKLHRLAEIWNAHCGNLPKVKGMGSSRTRYAISRMKDNDSEEYWIDVVKKIAASKFCNGHGSTGWRADFDFLVRPETHNKVLEGKYDDRGGQGRSLADLIEGES